MMISGAITDASRAHAVGARRRRVLELGRATRGRSRSALNCALGGADSCARTSPELRGSPTADVSRDPNAGLPNAFGEYDEAPEHTAEPRRRVRRERLVNIVGGCCGTTPTTRAIAEAVKPIAEAPRFRTR